MSGATVLFVAIAFALSMGFSFLVGSTGGPQSPYIQYALATMFFPAVALIFTRVVSGETLNIKWTRFSLLYLPIALFLIPLATHVVMLPVLYGLEGALSWQSWLTPAADGLHHTPATRGWGDLTSEELAGRIALNAGVGVLVVSAFAFFEEIGWRAWLLPRLAERAGPVAAVVGVAIIWALWHTPFALSGVHHVDGISPGELALIMPIGHLGAGLIIGWLWLKTESVWLAALAHGALNNWGQLAFKYMDDVGGHDAALLIAQGVALLVVGTILLAFFGPRSESET